jgi:hypothetical protein
MWYQIMYLTLGNIIHVWFLVVCCCLIYMCCCHCQTCVSHYKLVLKSLKFGKKYKRTVQIMNIQWKNLRTLENINELISFLELDILNKEECKLNVFFFLLYSYRQCQCFLVDKCSFHITTILVRGILSWVVMVLEFKPFDPHCFWFWIQTGL